MQRASTECGGSQSVTAIRSGRGWAGHFSWQSGRQSRRIQPRFLYGKHSLLPLSLGELVVYSGQAAGVGLVRTQPHPLTAVFAADNDTLSEYVHFRQYYRCVEPGGSSVQVLARYADQEATPALIEGALGHGRVLLFTSSVDLDWNDWARAPDGSYVVTMLELVQYLARRPTQSSAVVAGQQLALALSPDEYELSALFKSPVYPEEPAVAADASSPGQAVLLSGPEALHLGTYTVELTSRAGREETRPLCVNLDSLESDLAVATPAELEAALSGISHEYVTAADNFLQGAEQTRRELWPAVLLLVVLTLLSEQILAWRFGTPRIRKNPRGGPAGARPGPYIWRTVGIMVMLQLATITETRHSAFELAGTVDGWGRLLSALVLGGLCYAVVWLYRRERRAGGRRVVAGRIIRGALSGDAHSGNHLARAGYRNLCGTLNDRPCGRSG